MAGAQTDDTKMLPFSRVTVHPLALLSVVDHYNRVNKDVAPRRVVGILLGSIAHGVVDVLSCYAVPFEEDDDVWFLDHNFHETMARMCRKVNGMLLSQTSSQLLIMNFFSRYFFCSQGNCCWMVQHWSKDPLCRYPDQRADFKVHSPSGVPRCGREPTERAACSPDGGLCRC